MHRHKEKLKVKEKILWPPLKMASQRCMLYLHPTEAGTEGNALMLENLTEGVADDTQRYYDTILLQ